ncbi:hypothetical protein ACUOCP_32190, partial [Escherichia sp. R-CC3]
MNYQMITTDDALASLCEAVRAFPAIALDTEFVNSNCFLFSGRQKKRR